MAWNILGMYNFKSVWIYLLLFGRISFWNRTHLFDYEADVLFKLYFNVCSINMFGDECWFHTNLRKQSTKEERMQSCKNLIWIYHLTFRSIEKPYISISRRLGLFARSFRNMFLFITSIQTYFFLVLCHIGVHIWSLSWHGMHLVFVDDSLTSWWR